MSCVCHHRHNWERELLHNLLSLLAKISPFTTLPDFVKFLLIF